MSAMYPIYLRRKFPWHKIFTYYGADGQPVNLLNATITAWIKRHPDDAAPTLEFTVDILLPVSSGKFELSLTEEQILTLLPTSCEGKIKNYFYDVRLSVTGFPDKCLFEGMVYVENGITEAVS